MGADGGHQRRLSTTTASESRPAWSPDGSRIAYQAQGTGYSKEIRLTNPDGTCSVRVAGSASQWYQEPVWRPGALEGELPALCRN